MSAIRFDSIFNLSEIRNNHPSIFSPVRKKITVKFDVTEFSAKVSSEVDMTRLNGRKGFAVYETEKFIELHRLQSQPKKSNLICTCSLYESAVRITKAAAQSRRMEWKVAC